jgi:GT2 family glycosyltransferase
MNAPRISLVIPTFNRAAVLARCLEALRTQSAAPGDYEIVVVDDGSSDDTAAVVERAARAAPVAIRYARQANAGPGAARNRGVRLAAGAAVLFLGDDAIAGHDLVRAHLEVHHQHQRAAAVGAIVPENADRLSPFEQFLEGSGLQFDYERLRREADQLPFHMFYTANASAPRDALLEVGGFDEGFRYAAWEDVELAYRLSRVGVRFRYAPEAMVVHAHPTTLQQYTRRMNLSGRAARHLVELHPHQEITSLVAPLLMSPLGYRLGRARSLAAQALLKVGQLTGVEARYPRALYGLYSIILHYEFNRAYRAPLAQSPAAGDRLRKGPYQRTAEA